MATNNQLSKLVRLFTTFKSHLTIFIIANVMLWAIWFLTDGTNINSFPLYISVSWFVILAIHYLVAYEKIQAQKK